MVFKISKMSEHAIIKLSQDELEILNLKIGDEVEIRTRENSKYTTPTLEEIAESILKNTTISVLIDDTKGNEI